LLQDLKIKAYFGYPVERFEIFETHISYVLLTGPYAYKFKKLVDLEFLDFSTLEKRDVSHLIYVAPYIQFRIRPVPSYSDFCAGCKKQKNNVLDFRLTKKG
jgi:hypothetical protein